VVVQEVLVVTFRRGEAGTVVVGVGYGLSGSGFLLIRANRR
jgi:hypothetical protein